MGLGVRVSVRVRLGLGLGLGRRDGALRHEGARILRKGRLLGGDLGAHGGLREGRVVVLLVSVLTVADEVYEHVAAEALPEVDRQPADAHDRLWLGLG